MAKMSVHKDSYQMKVCAFCKYWYDPTNSVIAPKKSPNVWEYERGQKKICTIDRNRIHNSESRCSKFESKI